MVLLGTLRPGGKWGVNIENLHTPYLGDLTILIEIRKRFFSGKTLQNIHVVAYQRGLPALVG